MGGSPADNRESVARFRQLAKVLLFLVILSTVAFLAIRAPRPRASDIICPGDVNRDQQRDVRDVVLIQSHVLGKQSLSGDQLIAADVNRDNQVDVLDVVALTQHVTRKKLLPECRGALAVAPTSLDFGVISMGTNRDLQAVVSNTGNATATVTAVTSTNTQFAATSPTVPFSLLPGAQQAVTVRYTPAGLGAHTGTLNFAGTSAGATIAAQISVTGSGTDQANPKPMLASISPTSGTAGEIGLTLTVNGYYISRNSVVTWDGNPRPTTFVSDRQLTATISAADLATEDAIVVRIVTPAPGGGISFNAGIFTINPKAPTSVPLRFRIRYMAPTKGRTGTQFTLLGNGFSTTKTNNIVTFSQSGRPDVVASLTSASESMLVGTVPSSLTAGSCYVTVKIGNQTTGSVAFQVTTDAAPLELRPNEVVVLLPPGSAKETLLIGGGTPPYKLKALTAEQLTIANVQLSGNILEVTGAKYGLVDIEVQDSAGTPAKVTSQVRVQVPYLAPYGGEVTPFSLLSGTSPGCMLRFGTGSYQMRIAKMALKFEGGRVDVSRLSSPRTIGFLSHDNDTFGSLRVTGLESPTKARVEVSTTGEDGNEITARGFLESGRLDLTLEPEPGPESVNSYGVDTRLVLLPDVLTLPDAVGTPFTVILVFTSTTVYEGRSAPLLYTTGLAWQENVTIGLPDGSPRIAALGPDCGEIGREVWIRGSGFSPIAAQNQVTFAGPDNTRLIAPVARVGEGYLEVYVPEEAVTGPVEVKRDDKTSNPYLFRMMFSPDAAAGLVRRTSTGPLMPFITYRQPENQVRPASVKVVFSKGRIDASRLQAGTVLGTLQVEENYNGFSLWYIIYTGQETEGARRYRCEIKSGPTSKYVVGYLYLNENSGGAGVTIESWLDYPAVRQVVVFSVPWYLSPSTPTVMNGDIEVRSVPWMHVASWPMLVTMSDQIRID